ncbi:MAG: hypothetical protein ACKPKO_36765, partial [Candidatus Fonsibacter sp.]
HDDIYEWIKQNKQYLDMSDSKRPELKDNTNKKVLGKMKDEMNSLLMTEFLALNYQSIDEFNEVKVKNKKTLKGVSKTVVKERDKS